MLRNGFHDRGALCFVLSALLVPVCRHALMEKSVVSTNALDSESYALYSAIYRSSKGLASDEVIGIAAEPLSFPSDLSRLKPSTAEERQMVEAASAVKPDLAEWKRRFDLGRAYILIPPAATDKAIDCIGESQTNHHVTGCEPYVKLRYVRFLSIPIFNKDHTRALVAIDRSCGGLCGNGGIYAYRRTNKGWELDTTSFARYIWVSDVMAPQARDNPSV